MSTFTTHSTIGSLMLNDARIWSSVSRSNVRPFTNFSARCGAKAATGLLEADSAHWTTCGQRGLEQEAEVRMAQHSCAMVQFSTSSTSANFVVEAVSAVVTLDSRLLTRSRRDTKGTKKESGASESH